MADFRAALSRVLQFEGVYVNDPDDPGGETFCGIARRYYPGWPGWSKLDNIKNKDVAIQAILPEIEVFYREYFWGRIQGDKISYQEIANEVLECSVILGVHQSVKLLQKALNVLNRQGTLYKDLLVDGELGNVTIAALSWYAGPTKEKEAKLLVKTLNILQGSYFIDRMVESAVKEKYARGWLSRVSI